jgi:hypothetical protein
VNKRFFGLLMISISAILLGCTEDDCFTPPENIVFDFVDSSGNNLIKNGILDSSKIRVQQNEGDGTIIPIKIIVREDHKVSIEGTGWSEGTKNYDVYLLNDPVKIFNYRVTSSKITGDCSGYKIENLQIENINYVKETGYYRITIE